MLLFPEIYTIVLINFMILISILSISSLGFIIYWAISEKIFPFYIQTRSSYYYLGFILLSAFIFNLKSYDLFFFDMLLTPEWTESMDSVLELDCWDGYYSVGGMFTVTPASSIVVSIVLLFGSISSFIGYAYHKAVRYNYFEFPLYILFTTIAMVLIVSSDNAILTYVVVELQSLCFYLMASSQRKSIHSVEAGLKYLFVGSLASGFLLIGFGLIYYSLGTLNFSEMGFLLNHSIGFWFFDSLPNGVYFTKYMELFEPSLCMGYVGLFLVIVAILVKVAAAPFHIWAPDVYFGSPTAATCYFFLVPKLVFIFFLYRLSSEVFQWYGNIGGLFTLSDFFTVIVVLSFFVGYFGTITRGINLKRFFAFSGISHLGFILMGNIVEFDETRLVVDHSFGPVFSYLVLYALSVIPTNLMLLSFTKQTDFETGRRISYSIDSLPNGYLRINPSHAISIFMIFTVFIGLPPTSGFFSKLYPLIDVFVEDYFIFFVMLWVYILLSAYVYGRVMVVLFFTTPNSWNIVAAENGITFVENYYLVFISTFLIMFTGLYLFMPDLVESLSVLLTYNDFVYVLNAGGSFFFI